MPNHDSDPLVADAGQFATTRWSVVLAAGQDDSAVAMAALETLCRAYWYPLYAYVRRRGHAEHDAQDLTQGFFARLLERHPFKSVAPGQTKFRSFLLVALKNYLADEHDREQAQKRGGGLTIVSFDAAEAEQRYHVEPAHAETPERLFERQWATTLLDRTLIRIEQEFTAAGKRALLDALRGFILDDAEGRTCAQLAVELGMSEEAVKKAVQRLRRRYQDILREEIGHTVTQCSEVEEELRHLWSALGSS